MRTLTRSGVCLTAAAVLLSGAAGAAAAADPPPLTYPGDMLRVATGAPGQDVLGRLTVSNPATAGHATVYPCGDPWGWSRPDVSTVNFAAGQTVSNMVLAAANRSGDLCVYTSAAASLRFDRVGRSGAAAAAVPSRLVDTRGPAGTAAMPAAGTVTTVVGAASPGQTVFLNVTAVNPAGKGWAVAYPCGAGRPGTSMLNFVAGQTVAGLAAVRADVAGNVCVYTSAATHVLVDREGVAAASLPATPVRLLDTRLTGSGAPVDPATVTRVHAGAANTAVFATLTAVSPDTAGSVAAYTCGTAVPIGGPNVFAAGQTAATFVAATTDANGDLCLSTSARTHMLVDLAGPAAPMVVSPPVTVMDSSQSAPPLSDVFYLKGAAADSLSGGATRYLAPPATSSARQVAGGGVEVTVGDAASGEKWTVTLVPPAGEQFVTGRRYSTLPPAATLGAGAGLRVSGGNTSTACPTPGGDFTFQQLVRDSSGAIARVSAGFHQTCDGTIADAGSDWSKVSSGFVQFRSTVADLSRVALPAGSQTAAR